MKPFETLFVALPLIYEEYCEINALPKKDITAYLNSIEIQFWVFLGNKSNNKSNIAVISNKLNKPYTRLEKSILKKVKVKPKSYFKTFFDMEILGNFSILK